MFSIEELLARPVSFKIPNMSYSSPPRKESTHSTKRIIHDSHNMSDELVRINQLVKDFSVNKSNAWIYPRSTYGEKITHNELIRIAKIVSAYTGIKVSRDAKRRKVVLLKWFDENWASIKPVLAMVSI
ncbi:hypothetical protein TVAG_077330 [Trichomonas vaginalis G3]|uniref:Uncharacterized protein n=1 Tax=Trichomonas vaginalis (strain ATCC PRA-98 / G3) TaxID=412133 RepID=A2E2U1_TRIV3|nr:hypothetical protein TVAGG3_0896690 [Trichomonas vaginalis G3]EAY12996.1 hypothetical protein TVAG_077330 [Trichomonas vaginalis G3]KAI5503126.1 hypothetical protein TVAGG3_0896690 [Trichomonas vaginalis G3]|eukprot:XP_001325219.1 hypothetical protein [Trichomonas vaginalis G3]